MNRTTLRALFALGLGSGLGFIVAESGLDSPRSALAASEQAARSPQVTACPEGKASCSEGMNRHALLALATTAVQPAPAAPVQAKKKPNIVVIWGDDIGQ